jgi:uncharacterized delta-60 repeat protein
MFRALRAFSCIAAALAAASVSAALNPGDLDPSFGAGGIRIGAFLTSDDLAHGADPDFTSYVAGAAIEGSTSRLFFHNGNTGRTLRIDDPSEGRQVRRLADGSALVVGTRMGSSWQPILVRYLGSGALDTTFGQAGVVTIVLPAPGSAQGMALDLQADGKIVIAASLQLASGDRDMAVLRMNADGSLDATFGVNGLRTIDFRGGYDLAAAVSVTTDQKILVAGLAANSAGQPGGTYGFGIARLDSSGSIDPAFGPAGQGGRVVIGAGGTGAYANAMRVSGNAIWLAGNTTNLDSSLSMVVMKLDLNGLPDNAFNGNGVAKTVGGSGQAASLLPDATGVLLGGWENGSFAMARFNLDGSPDTAFGINGRASDPAPGQAPGIIALSLGSGGTIVAMGSVPEDADPQRQNLARVVYGSSGASGGPGTGKTLYNLNGFKWQIAALDMEPDGKLVLGGYIGDGSASDFATVRLDASGNIDGSYGYKGVATVPMPATQNAISAMLRLPDGRRILAGVAIRTQSSSPDVTQNFAMARTWESGSLDPSFGDAGRRVYSVGLRGGINALAAYPGGRILAAGWAETSTDVTAFAIARILPDGDLDPAFGTNGVAFVPFGGGRQDAKSIALLPDGRIVVAGVLWKDDAKYFAVTRLQPNGAIDASFGTAGFATLRVRPFMINGGPVAHEFVCMAVLPNGKILLGGSNQGSTGPIYTTGTDMIMARLNADGSPDDSFGTSGTLLIPIAGDSWIQSIAVQPNGKIVFAGGTSAEDSGTFPFAARYVVGRLMPDGALDPGFGSNGFSKQDLSPYEDHASALALRRDGRIVSAGTAAWVTDGRWTAVRMIGDPRAASFPTDFDNDGRSDILYRNATTGQVYRILMNGLNVASSAQAYVEPNLDWKIAAEGDFNGDGVTDLLWRNTADGRVFVMPFNASGFPAGGAVVYTEVDPAWKVVGTPDIDGDGKADILWWNGNTGFVYAQLLNGASITQQGYVYREPDTAWKIAAAGDLAGSGKRNQLLWRHDITGQVYLMTVGVGGGAFSQSGQMIYTEPDTAWKILAAPDLDGDGKSDILWRNASTGEVYGLLMNGPAVASRGRIWIEPDMAWKVVAQGDYDGDGKSDLLWRNESTGEVYMMLMNGLAIALQRTVYEESNTAWKVLGPYEYNK